MPAWCGTTSIKTKIMAADDKVFILLCIGSPSCILSPFLYKHIPLYIVYIVLKRYFEFVFTNNNNKNENKIKQKKVLINKISSIVCLKGLVSQSLKAYLCI